MYPHPCPLVSLVINFLRAVWDRGSQSGEY